MNIFILLILTLTIFSEASEKIYPPNKTYKSKLNEIEKVLNFSGDSEAVLKKLPYDNRGFYLWMHPQHVDVLGENPAAGFLGRSNNPSSEVRHIIRTENKLIFDAIYRFDENGNRITVSEGDNKKNKFLALFGCSFTMGIGLNDNETLSSLIQSSNSEFSGYNFAIAGAGPNTILAQSEFINYKKIIKENDGVFVAVYLGFHIERALGYIPTGNYSAKLPYYVETDSKTLKYSGSFETGRPVLTWGLLRIMDLFGNNILKNRIFPIPDEADYRRICKMYSQSRDNLKKQFPNSEFIVYLHPSSPEMEDSLRSCLVKEFKVNLIESSLKNINPLDEQYSYIVDGHPKKKFNQLIAENILIQSENILKK